MNLHRLGTVIGIELRQRVRSVGWYVLLGVFFVILMAVLALSFASFALASGGNEWFFSLVIMLVLLLVLLVSPTLSGSALNGDRDAATLAPVQVTLVTTAEIVIGKFLAALGILVLEVGVVAAVGVGFSAVVARPIFSVASTYLVIAALSIGTLIAFGLGGLAVRSEQVSITRDFDWNALPEGCAPGALDGSSQCPTYDELPCIENRYTSEVPRFDRVWWVLAANPFVILADATPPTYVDGYPRDLFSQIAYSVRLAQKAPETETRFDGCVAPQDSWSNETPEDQLEGTVPSWFVGLFVQLIIAAGLLTWGIARTRTPAKRLPPGTRIA